MASWADEISLPAEARRFIFPGSFLSKPQRLSFAIILAAEIYILMSF